MISPVFGCCHILRPANGTKHNHKWYYSSNEPFLLIWETGVENKKDKAWPKQHRILLPGTHKAKHKEQAYGWQYHTGNNANVFIPRAIDIHFGISVVILYILGKLCKWPMPYVHIDYAL